jgi:hypothetical protein
MPLLQRETPEGPVWVRPPYRPADYTVPPEALALFARWPADGRDAAAILALAGESVVQNLAIASGSPL